MCPLSSVLLLFRYAIPEFEPQHAQEAASLQAIVLKMLPAAADLHDFERGLYYLRHVNRLVECRFLFTPEQKATLIKTLLRFLFADPDPSRHQRWFVHCLTWS